MNAAQYDFSQAMKALSRAALELADKAKPFSADASMPQECEHYTELAEELGQACSNAIISACEVAAQASYSNADIADIRPVIRDLIAESLWKTSQECEIWREENGCSVDENHEHRLGAFELGVGR